MSSRKTTNLGLHAWEPADPFTREEFNENFAALDADAGKIRKEAETQLASAAATAAGAAAEAKSAAAAAQSTADAAASAAAAAQRTADTATQTAQSARTLADGRVKIATGYRVGTGTRTHTNAANALEIQIGFKPKLLLLSTNGDESGMLQIDQYLSAGYMHNPWLFITQDMQYVRIKEFDSKAYLLEHNINFIWTETSVKWYASPNNSESSTLTAEGYLNKQDVVYRWVAFG